MSGPLVLSVGAAGMGPDPVADGGDRALTWPQLATGETAWAVRLHDELDARATPATAADIARIASWLRVQAVGRDAVGVVEPRVAEYAMTWAAAAAAAGLSDTLLVRSAGERAEPVPIPTPTPPRGEPVAPAWTAGVGSRSRYAGRARLWLVDRAEGAMRYAVRTLQR